MSRPRWQRAEYEWFARRINVMITNATTVGERLRITSLAGDLANKFEADHPDRGDGSIYHFDRERFLRACGIDAPEPANYGPECPKCGQPYAVHNDDGSCI